MLKRLRDALHKVSLILRRRLARDDGGSAVERSLTVPSAIASGAGAVAVGGSVRFSLITTAPLIAAPLLSFFGKGSLRSDRAKLKRRTALSLRLLRRFSYIPLDGREIHIHRQSTAALIQSSRSASLLVTGEPGVGKSAELFSLASSLVTSGQDVIYLAADQLTAESLELLGSELGLSHHLLDVLESWKGAEPGYLIIDALDAARADAAAQTLRDLLALVVNAGEDHAPISRWRAIASIRSYDLKYASELASQFAVERFPISIPVDDALRDPQFAHVRHLRIPRLRPDEIQELVSRAPALKRVIDGASPSVRELLRVPFNLRIAAELTAHGQGTLTEVHAQADLLARYWDLRVIQSVPTAAAFEREAMLREITDVAVRARALTVRTGAITRTVALRWALSTSLLVEGPGGNRATIAFAHHILFDYAVARLLLDGESAAIPNRLRTDPGFVLFGRPSLDFHFHELWSRAARVDGTERTEFWSSILEIAGVPEIPSIGKLIGAAAAAARVEGISDLEPLVRRLEGPASFERKAADEILRHMLAAVNVGGRGTIVGPAGGPWAPFIERVTREPRVEVVEAIWAVLSHLFEKPNELTPLQATAAGQTARRLLEFERTRPEPNRWRASQLAQWVARTYSTDRIASHNLLIRGASEAYIPTMGFGELFWMAEEAEALMDVDPELVEQMYAVAFTESAQTRGSSSPSPHYRLSKVFPAFLKIAPSHASRALMRAVDAYIASRHQEAELMRAALEVEEGTVAEGEPEVNEIEGGHGPFPLWGFDVRFKADFSAIWDTGDTYSHDDAVGMLDAFRTALGEAADAPTIRELVTPAVVQVVPAVVWRRIIQAANARPRELGMQLRELLVAPAVLAARDTTYEAGQLLRAVFPLVEADERAAIEDAIMAIPSRASNTGWSLEGLERLRDRLLSCLRRADIVTASAQRRVDELSEESAPPENEPLFGGVSTTTSAISNEEWLAQEGVPVDAPENVRLRTCAEPVKAFATRFLNGSPTPQAASDVFQSLQHCERELREVAEAHPVQRDDVYSDLVGACAVIARMPGLNVQSHLGAFVRRILIEASQHSLPLANDEQETFDRFPSWGSRSPRVTAAQGLMELMANASVADMEVGRAIGGLARDSAKAVRLQVAVRLGALIYKDVRLDSVSARELLKERALREQSPPILVGLIESLRAAHSRDEVYVAYAVDVLLEILSRYGTYDGAPEGVLDRAILALVEVDVWHEECRARLAIDEFIAKAPTIPAVAGQFVSHLRGLLAVGDVEGNDAVVDVARLRAVALVMRMAQDAHDALDALRRQYPETPLVDWPPSDQKRSESARSILERVATELYFGAGVFDEEQGRDAARTNLAVRKRFVIELGDTLDLLVAAADEERGRLLFETLEYLAKATPADVLPRIEKLISSLDASGQLDQAGIADKVVRCLEWYLAAQRPIFRERVELRDALLTTLDTLVKRAVPSALRLAYRAEDIYR